MDVKGDRLDHRVAMLAARQHGVVAIGQLRELGVGRDAVRRRVEAGRLHRLHQGVYAVGHTAPSPHRRWMAAVVACRRKPDAARAGQSTDSESSETGVRFEHWGVALSHRSAAQLWGLLPVRKGPTDVSVRGYGGKKKRRGIRLHRSLALRPATVTLRQGIPVTTPARTIADLHRIVGKDGSPAIVSSKELRRAIRQANFLGLSIDEGARKERSRSDLELDFQALCRRFGLPPPEVNVRVGPHVVDFYWRRSKLVVETDGYGSHRGRAAFEDDRGSDLDLRALGFTVVRLAEKQVIEEAAQVAAVIADLLR